MKIFTKQKIGTSRIHIYLFGIKIFSYRQKSLTPQYMLHPTHGKIYHPIYNKYRTLDTRQPNIYDQNGNPKEAFFIRDIHCGPYMSNPNKFMWDRYNIGLPTHFYTHNAMLETMGNPTHRYGWLFESRTIVPDDYEIFNKYAGLEQDFDAIFTHDDKILETVKNAKFLPYCAQLWFGIDGDGQMDDMAYTKKTKNISIVSSNKVSCELHNVRLNLARLCKSNGLADTYGTFDGGRYIKVCEALSDYRYSICIENAITDYFFTERLTNCFASHTIPIYLGARKISKFFNPDGMIILDPKDLDNIENILRQCSEQDYQQRIPAILDNYQRVQKYKNMDDYLYDMIYQELQGK